MKSKLIYGLIGMGIFIVFYLSWIPNPRIGEEVYLPNWLAKWTDAEQNDTIRTGVPFLGIGVLLGFYLKNHNAEVKAWPIAIAVLTVVAFLAELGQLFMTFRYFDIKDIFWAFVGSCIGLLSGYLISRLVEMNKIR